MNVTKNTREAAEKVGDKLEDAAQETGHQASTLAGNVADKAREAARTVTEKAGDAAHFVGEKADDAAAYVGGGLDTLAHKVRDKAPKEGVFGSAADTLARGIERTGDYLKEEGVTGMGRDMVELVRRYPIPALLVGVGLGYLIARSTTRS